MRLVTFGRVQAPHGVGDTRLVPDDIAERLEAEGVLSASKPWPEREGHAPPISPRAVSKPIRPAGAPDKRRAR